MFPRATCRDSVSIDWVFLNPSNLLMTQRAALSRYYMLKYVGETALSGLPKFWAASLFKTKHSKLNGA